MKNVTSTDKDADPLLTAAGIDPESFDLKSFFPYRVRLYYQAISDSVADIYTPLLGLSVSEWRTMVVLGTQQALSAGEIVERSSMDKVAVSRAIKRMREAKLLRRDIDGDDRRRAVLRLTEEGAQAYRRLVPLVRQLEADLLEDLSEAERGILLSLMERVRQNALAVKRRKSAAT